MGKKKYRLILRLGLIGVISLWICPEVGFAEQDGGIPGAYLFWGAGVRSLGLGRAYTAGCEDASSVYWNPAGLSLIKRKELVAAYSLLNEDTPYSFLGLALPRENVGIGLGIVDLRSSGLDKRNQDNEDIGDFDVAQTAGIIALSKKICSAFYLGGSVKIVREKIDTYSDTGYGADLGVMYKYKLMPVSAGLYLQNIIKPVIKLIEEEDKFPFSVRFGVDCRILENKLYLAIDTLKIDGEKIKMYCGGEYRLMEDLISARLGINENEITSGFGIEFLDFQLDYAFVYRSAWRKQSEFYFPHRIGITIKWGGEKGVPVR